MQRHAGRNEYPRLTRTLLLLAILIHTTLIGYELVSRIEGVQMRRVYDVGHGLRSMALPGYLLTAELTVAYGMLMFFMIGLAVSLYRGLDCEAAKIYAAFV